MLKRIFCQPINKASFFQLALMVVVASSVLFTGNAQAVCSAYKNLATINEVHRSGNSTRFIEVKLLNSAMPLAPGVGPK